MDQSWPMILLIVNATQALPFAWRRHFDVLIEVTARGENQYGILICLYGAAPKCTEDGKSGISIVNST